MATASCKYRSPHEDIAEAEKARKTKTDPPGGVLRMEANARFLEIPANHLLADRTRNRLYMTIGQQGTDFDGSFAVLDPETEQVLSSLPLGIDPGEMALSPDGDTLWVSPDVGELLRPITLTTDPPSFLPATAGLLNPPGPAVAILPLENYAGIDDRVLIAYEQGDGESIRLVLMADIEPLAQTEPLFPGPRVLRYGPNGLVLGASGSDINALYAFDVRNDGIDTMLLTNSAESRDVLFLPPNRAALPGSGIVTFEPTGDAVSSGSFGPWGLGITRLETTDQVAAYERGGMIAVYDDDGSQLRLIRRLQFQPNTPMWIGLFNDFCDLNDNTFAFFQDGGIFLVDNPL